MAADLRGSPGEVLSLAGDVGSTEEVERVVSETVRAFGEISIVVNNAGIQTERPFLELPVADWDSVINTNLKGTFLVSQASAKVMVRDSIAGRIVNITSVHQDMPRSGIAHYAASKGGVQMLTKVMAVELAEYGITVNCVAPGAVATPMNQPFLDSPSLVKEFSARVPVGRIASPEEIAQGGALPGRGRLLLHHRHDDLRRRRCAFGRSPWQRIRGPLVMTPSFHLLLSTIESTSNALARGNAGWH